MWGGLATASTSDARKAVPLWVGEFGENTDSRWWGWILRYLKERKFGFSYWAVDGEQRLGQEESFGLLEMDYATVRDEWKLTDLQSLQ